MKRPPAARRDHKPGTCLESALGKGAAAPPIHEADARGAWNKQEDAGDSHNCPSRRRAQVVERYSRGQHASTIANARMTGGGSRNTVQRRIQWVAGVTGIALLAICLVAHGQANLALAHAQQLQSAQRYSRAIEVYNRVLKAAPSVAAAWMGRGQSNLALARTSAAKADFAHWRKVDPTNPYASIWLYIASIRAHARDAGRALTVPRDTANWPLSIIRYLAGQTDWETMFNEALAAPRAVRDRELCEAALVFGENVLAAGKMEPAMEGFTVALRHCASRGVLRALALSEYQRLYRAGYRDRPEE